MRMPIAILIGAALAASAPALAQDTNTTNVQAPTTVVAGPDASINNVEQPALPATNDMAAAPIAAPATEPAYEPAPAPARKSDGGFPWGLIGLVGLVGLLGRSRG